MKLTSREIISFIEGESARLIDKYKELDKKYFYPRLYRETLKRVELETADDTSYYSRNIKFLIAWEILLKVIIGLEEKIPHDFPHLVLGAIGQGLLQKLNKRTQKLYKVYLQPIHRATFGVKRGPSKK